MLQAPALRALSPCRSWRRHKHGARHAPSPQTCGQASLAHTRADTALAHHARCTLHVLLGPRFVVVHHALVQLRPENTTLNLMSAGTQPAAAARRSSIELSFMMMQRAASVTRLPLFLALAPFLRAEETLLRGRAIARGLEQRLSGIPAASPERRVKLGCDAVSLDDDRRRLTTPSREKIGIMLAGGKSGGSVANLKR